LKIYLFVGVIILYGMNNASKNSIETPFHVLKS
jgi:hypothetical protein